MNTQSASLLINFHSRRSRQAYGELEQACLDSGIELDKVYELKKNVDFGRTIASIKRAKPKLLIVAGGDGTVSKTLSLMAGSPIEIGIVPLGTTNNFARSLDLPLTVSEAVKVIADSAAQPVDLGVVGRHYFTNVAGIGMSALVAKGVSDQQKRRYGRLAYAIVGLKHLIKHKPFFVTVTDKDKELELHFETHQIIVANGRYHAGRKIAEGASVDSQQLIVFAIGGRSRWSFMARMLDFYVGNRKSVRHASYLIARDIAIETSSRTPSEVDGEIYESTPLKFKIAADAIKIRYGDIR